MIDDREAKRRVVEIIRARFEQQGGTGYGGQSDLGGCYCALSAAVGEPVGYSEAFRRLVEMGVRQFHAMALYVVHDEALGFAKRKDMDGFVWHPMPHVFRALCGSEAYNHVMSKLEEWANC